ncbi:MAG: enolase C-terminal domain-like protein [Dehalobacterium sp.]
MEVKKIDVYQVNMPLINPYYLSFGDITYFPMILSVVETLDGQKGIGESTALPGYSRETLEEMWSFTLDKGQNLPGQPVENILERLSPYCEKFPFSAAPIITALETLAYGAEYNRDNFNQEMLGLINSNDLDEINKEVAQLIEQGFKTLKVKVGKNVKEDINKTKYIQEIVSDRVILRIDANQAYDYEDAEHYVKSINPGNVELFEQPFGIDKWDDMRRLNEVSPIPLMLDESIHSEADLEKTIQLRCAQFVKFKLMKIGSLKRLEKLMKMALESGLQVVLGNGVAGEIGCYHEALVCKKLLNNAGEMNGFLKQSNYILENILTVTNGKIAVPANFSPEIINEKIKPYVQKVSNWSL